MILLPKVNPKINWQGKIKELIVTENERVYCRTENEIHVYKIDLLFNIFKTYKTTIVKFDKGQVIHNSVIRKVSTQFYLYCLGKLL